MRWALASYVQMSSHQEGQGASLEAIEGIYRSRLAEFRRVAAAIIGDRELGCDAVQEGFALAVRHRADFRGNGPLEAWLWRIVINATRSRRRSVEPLAAELPAELPAAVPANGHAAGRADRVRGAIALLSERQRLVLFLHYYADLDYAAIGEALEIAPGTVGATLHSARAAIRRLLGEEIVR
jgi:RNA polymerase sigma factor (sigma-70 family)